MCWITEIEIEHFRSINKLTVKDLSDINVFSGLNDVGKSNVIKALNLFFNNQTDWQSPLDFGRDTNTWHTHYSQKGKVRKQISVKLTFSRPLKRYPSLPDVFWIKRQWDRDNPNQPRRTWGEVGTSESKSARKQATITKFLNQSSFFYVPAVRGRDYFQHLLRQFSEAITDTQDEELKAASDNLSAVIESRSSDLIKNLKGVTGLEFTFELPQSMLALLEAAGLITEGGIPLQMRGDGIQGLTVPGILAYLSRSSSKFHFWGFEEPENSLEYIKATQLAEGIYETYSKQAQVFLSTHSPAFLAMQDDKTTIYRVFQKSEVYEQDGHKEDVTKIEPVFIRGEDYQGGLLPKELGFFEVVRKIDCEYKEFENQKTKIESLEAEIRQLTKPTLIVEGKNDLETLEHAWDRLYTEGMPFKIIEAGGVDKPGGAGKSGGAKKITGYATHWVDISEQRMCALYDHDGEGNKAIQGLKKHFSNDFNSPYCRYKHGDQVLAITLPVPEIPEREAQAKNLNLTLEFYFSNSVLMEIDKQPGCELFSTTTYIEKGKPKPLCKDRLKTLIDAGQVTIVHRQVVDPGKRRLVESMANLPDKEFKAFHKLFSIIVDHLVPDFDLTSNKKEAQQLLTPAAKGGWAPNQDAERPGCGPDVPPAP